jgi:hypothetical protein
MVSMYKAIKRIHGNAKCNNTYKSSKVGVASLSLAIDHNMPVFWLFFMKITCYISSRISNISFGHSWAPMVKKALIGLIPIID